MKCDLNVQLCMVNGVLIDAYIHIHVWLLNMEWHTGRALPWKPLSISLPHVWKKDKNKLCISKGQVHTCSMNGIPHQEEETLFVPQHPKKRTFFNGEALTCADAANWQRDPWIRCSFTFWRKSLRNKKTQCDETHFGMGACDARKRGEFQVRAIRDNVCFLLSEVFEHINIFTFLLRERFLLDKPGIST